MGAFGSVRERALPEIWDSPEYRDLVAGGGDRQECAGCALRRPGGF
jgi:hypothetical protein